LFSCTQEEEREVTLHLEEIEGEDGRQTPLSQCSRNLSTGDYVITNTTVDIGEFEKDPLGLVETIGIELEEQELREADTGCGEHDLANEAAEESQSPQVKRGCPNIHKQ